MLHCITQTIRSENENCILENKDQIVKKIKNQKRLVSVLVFFNCLKKYRYIIFAKHLKTIQRQSQ